MGTAIAEQEHKTCSDCGVLKPQMRFHRKRVGADGVQQYQSYCRECQRARVKTTYDKHGAAYRERNREAYNTRKRTQQRERKYGVTQDRYDQMLADQAGRCAVCREEFPRPQSACVDHDHATGRVRGLLCDPCNRAIGYLKDSSERAIDLAAYLTKETA